MHFSLVWTNNAISSYRSILLFFFIWIIFMTHLGDVIQMMSLKWVIYIYIIFWGQPPRILSGSFPNRSSKLCKIVYNNDVIISDVITIMTSLFICHPNLVSMECYDSVSTFVSSPEFKNQEIEDFHILSFLEKSKSSRHRNECTFGSYRGSRTSPYPCWVTFRFISIGIYS